MYEKIKSELIYAGERRYYMDLKENSRGRFLKVITILFFVWNIVDLSMSVCICLGGIELDLCIYAVKVVDPVLVLGL